MGSDLTAQTEGTVVGLVGDYPCIVEITGDSGRGDDGDDVAIETCPGPYQELRIIHSVEEWTNTIHLDDGVTYEICVQGTVVIDAQTGLLADAEHAGLGIR